MLQNIRNWFRPAPKSRPKVSLRLEGLEDRQMMTTTGWATGAPPKTMTFAAQVQVNLDQVSASRTVSSVLVKDNVGRAVTFVAPTTGDYVIRTAQGSGQAAFDSVLGVYDSHGVRLAYNDDASSSNKFSALHVSLKAGQTYEVGVGRYIGHHSPDAVARYCSLSIDGPNDDRNETLGGDTFGTAVGLTIGIGQNQVTGLAMMDTADYFKFHLPSTGSSSDAVSIAFKNSQGNLNLALYSANGTVLGTSAGTTDGERISMAGRPAGDYVIRVTGAANPSYSLSVVHQQTQTPAPVVDLGAKVVAWAKARLGQQIGDGQCATTVDAALKAVGAKSVGDLGGPQGADADYVWGTPVLTFNAGDNVSVLSQLKAGDIIQFRNVVIHTTTATGWSESSSPHHTAIVESNDGGGTMHILQSNVNGNLTVSEAVMPFADMTQGTIWVYRPTAA